MRRGVGFTVSGTAQEASLGKSAAPPAQARAPMRQSAYSWSLCYLVLFWLVMAVLTTLLLALTECLVSDVC